MLEPTKEPLKPLSAAEKIASIGQSSHISPDISSSDQLQESLPPVQFDWSSSGLTNPLDGTSLRRASSSTPRHKRASQTKQSSLC
ncbi:hypothetical protein AB205_0043420 [Aquarana catesbeiana]|uniref:Aftiphilin clathrin-binding box domain-containing protein n=1 Tax=Aquarana catesbeiana TaxID=8400 RepID=A0A2G9SDQ8_AQUCT|nr:hypothetical protein AB205_0043420 [Aquarana catesbeiana]